MKKNKNTLNCSLQTFTKNGLEFNPTALSMTILIIAVLMQTPIYCADAASNSEMDTMATNLVSTIFAPWVRKTALAFGGGWGMFQSISGGSFKPLLIWGGIGIFVNFIPKIIGWFGV